MSENRFSHNSKTPTKNKRTTLSTSRELKTPSKPIQPGIPQTVHTHGTTLHSLFNNWLRLRDQGTLLCKTLLALRLHELSQDDYPDKLEKLINGLIEAMDALEGIVESIGLVRNQFEAVAQLSPSPEPVIGSWSAGDIARKVGEIHRLYQDEAALKKYVTENIAHSREEGLSVTMATAWELEAYVNPVLERYLLTDLGITSSH